MEPVSTTTTSPVLKVPLMKSVLLRIVLAWKSKWENPEPPESGQSLLLAEVIDGLGEERPLGAEGET